MPASNAQRLASVDSFKFIDADLVGSHTCKAKNGTCIEITMLDDDCLMIAPVTSGLKLFEQKMPTDTQQLLHLMMSSSEDIQDHNALVLMVEEEVNLHSER